MKIIFWGTPEYSVQTLEKLILSEHQIVAVVTQPDRKRSRGKSLIPSPIKKIALKNKIPVLSPVSIKNNIEFIQSLKELHCDIFVVVAYGKILSKEILEIPPFGSWNSHASLLPRWRGAAPIQWALISGDGHTGVGIMKMEEGLDTGDILLEEKLIIEEKDNLTSLTEKLGNLSSILFLKALDEISNNFFKELKMRKQNELKREVKYARLIDKLDFILTFEQEAINIQRKIKGLYPKVFIKYKNKNIKILKIRIIDNNHKEVNKFLKESRNSCPGTIIGIIKDEGIVVSTLTEPILILELRVEGKNTSRGSQLIQQLKPIIGELIG